MKVIAAVPCVKGTLYVQTVHSLMQTRAAVEFETQFFAGSSLITARTLAAHHFLQSDADVMFCIDDDVQWEPQHFVRLLVRSQSYPCIVGVYPARREPPRPYIKLIPGEKPNADGLVKIAGTGLGFACIRREVMQTLADQADEILFAGKRMKAIYREDIWQGEKRGEDYAFWADVRAAGFDVHADTQAKIGHVGPKVFYMNGSSSQSCEQEKENGTTN